MKILLAPLLLAATAIAPVQAQPPGAAAQTGTAFDTRAAQLVDLLNGKLVYTDYFAPNFQAAIPEAQFKTITASLIAQYGTPLAVEAADSSDGRAGTARVRFEKGVGTIAIEVAPDTRVTGLRITGFDMANDSYDKVAADLAALPGTTGFLVAELNEGTPTILASAHPDAQFAVGSTFKLYILDELAAQIAAGKRSWSDVVPLSHLSFSSAATANWPKGTPVTLQTLANWMISVSDNGAADTLIHLLGRDAIEARMKATGHSDPSRNIPFLTTVEAFALKGNNFTAQRKAFVAGDDAGQRALLAANADRLTLANVDGISFGAEPRFIDSIEWFASPADVARVLADIHARGSDQAMAALAINPGVAPATTKGWSYIGYKGGSENGVLAMSFIGTRKSDGRTVVVTASWNDPTAGVSSETMVAMAGRLLALAAK